MGFAPEIDVLIPALSQLPLAAAMTDGGGVVRWVNGRTESLTGYGRDEIIGRSVESPECPLHFASIVAMEDLRADAPLEAEAAWTKKNGLTCAVSAAITPVKDHSGAVTHALWVFTPRSRGEEELLRTAARYSAIFTSMAEGVVFQAADGRIEACNPSAERILGLTADQMAGRKSVDPRWASIHEDGSPFPGETHPAMVSLRTGEPLRNVVMGVHKPDGSLTWISINSQPLAKAGQPPYAVVTTFVDITERKITERLAAKKQQEFETFFNLIPDIACVLSADGFFKKVNPAFGAALGWSSEELLTTPFLEFNHPDDLAGGTAAASTHFSGRNATGFVGRYRHKDGSFRWLEWRATDVLDGQVFATALDITERKRAEEELKRAHAAVVEAEARFQRRFNGISDAVFVFRLEADVASNRLADVNNAACRLLGYTRDELLGRQLAAVDAPENHPFAPGVAQRLRDEGAVIHETTLMARDGRRIPVELSIQRFEAEGADMMIGTARDITERKRAEEELKRAHAAAAEAELHFHRLFNGLSDAVFVLQLEGDIAQSRVIDANDAACSILGCTREEVLGRLATDFGAPENYRMAPAVAQRLGEAGKLTRETTLVAKDGRRIPVEVILQRFEGGGAALLLATARDITERKRAEAELQRAHDDVAAAERHYRFLFESGSDAIFLHRRNPDGGPGETLDVNENACRYLGYTREELLQLEIADICVPEEVPALSARRPQLLADRQLVVEMTHVAKDGRRIPVEIHGRALEIGGAPVILSHVRDISERRRAEAELRSAHEAVAASERHYRLLFESGSDAIFLHRFCPDGRPGELLEVNENACRYLGYTREELLRLDFTAIGAPEEASAILERKRRLAKDRELAWEMIHVARDGRRIPVEIHSRVLDIGDSPVLLSHVRDISRRLEAERRYQDLFESAIEGIYSCSLEGRLLRANPAYAAMLGYESVHDLMSSVKDTGRQVWADARVRAAVLERLAAEGFLIGYEAQFKKKDGTPIWVSFNSQMVYGPDGRPASTQGFVVEITNRKRSEAQAAHLEEQLRQAQKLESVGRLAGGIAHEFNNLLTVINGYSELLLDRLHPSDPLRRCAQAIMDSGDRAASLTRQLLGFGRRQLARPRALDLNATVASFAGMIRSVLGEKFSLATDLDGSLGEVMADPDQVNQVLMNLVLNARDAMPQGGSVRIATANAEFDADSISAHDAEAAAGRYVRLSVTDTGHGMDEETRQRVFEPFFTTKAVGEGAGLGLATVFGIAHQNGGWVEAESELGEGSCFSVYLPRTDATPRADRGGPAAPGRGGAETILVVEDQAHVLELTKMSLEEHGYRVITARSGEEAITVVGEHQGPIHLLVSDIVLPGLNGRELFRRLKGLRPGLKVIYISGYAVEVLGRDGGLEPDTPFLKKPFSAGQLASMVRAALSGED